MHESLSHLDEWLIYFGLFIILFFISWVMVSLFGQVKKVKESASTKRRTMGFFSSLIVLLTLAVMLLLFAVTRIYTTFSSHEHVATVQCRPAYGFGGNAFEMLYTPITDGRPGEQESYILKGEKWSVGGDILEWQNYVTIIGLKSMYRLTRIQGLYAEAEDEMLNPITAFPLVKEEQSDFWKTLADIAVKTPFIKSVHQNFVSTFPYYGDTFYIYVTPSGFTLERFQGK